MPSYASIYFGFRGEEAGRAAAAALGLTLDLEEGVGEAEPGRKAAIRAALEEIHLKAVGRLAETMPGFTYLGKKPYWSHDPSRLYHTYDTPWGRRTISPMGLCLSFDPDEIGDEPEDAVFGVGLSSRYLPGLLDMDDENGSLEGEEEYFAWSQDAEAWQVKAAEIACALIVEAYPVFAGASLIQKTDFA